MPRVSYSYSLYMCECFSTELADGEWYAYHVQLLGNLERARGTITELYECFSTELLPVAAARHADRVAAKGGTGLCWLHRAKYVKVIESESPRSTRSGKGTSRRGDPEYVEEEGLTDMCTMFLWAPCDSIKQKVLLSACAHASFLISIAGVPAGVWRRPEAEGRTAPGVHHHVLHARAPVGGGAPGVRTGGRLAPALLQPVPRAGPRRTRRRHLAALGGGAPYIRATSTVRACFARGVVWRIVFWSVVLACGRSVVLACCAGVWPIGVCAFRFRFFAVRPSVMQTCASTWMYTTTPRTSQQSRIPETPGVDSVRLEFPNEIKNNM